MHIYLFDKYINIDELGKITINLALKQESHTIQLIIANVLFNLKII